MTSNETAAPKTEAAATPAVGNVNSSWTGGQWSLVRICLGLYVLVHMLQLLPWAPELFSNTGVLPQSNLSPFSILFPNPLAWFDQPWFVSAFIATAIPASLLLIAGQFDRPAAIWLWFVWACCFGRNPLISNPSLPYVGWLLLFHACLPTAPYLSWAARERIDPAGNWGFQRSFQSAAWILLAVGYTYSGLDKILQSPSWQDGTALEQVLSNALARDTGLRIWLLSLPAGLLKTMTWGALAIEILYLPLACFRQTRPWIWLAAVLMQIGILCCVDFADLTFGMLIFHLATFDPDWIKPQATGVQTIGYDGDCGACHRFIRLVLAEDKLERFQFAPLQSPEFSDLIGAETLAQQPDSVIVKTADGQLLTKSTAVLYVLRNLGGLWAVASWMFRIIPRGLRDLGYDGIAKIRKSLFPAPKQSCPILPAKLRQRFLPMRVAA